MTRVFIANYAGHDYSDAAHYGEFKYITKGYVSFQSLDRVKYSVTEAVMESHKEDWLLLSGKPLLCALAAIAWFALHDQVKLLVWDQKSKNKGYEQYRELVITKANLIEMMAVLTSGDEADRG